MPPPPSGTRGGQGHGDSGSRLPSGCRHRPVSPGLPPRGEPTCSTALSPGAICRSAPGAKRCSLPSPELAASQLGERGSCSLLGGLVIHEGKTETLPNCASPEPEPSIPDGGSLCLPAALCPLRPLGLGTPPWGWESSGHKGQRPSPHGPRERPLAEPTAAGMLSANRFCCAANRTASCAQPDPLVGASWGKGSPGIKPLSRVRKWEGAALRGERPRGIHPLAGTARHSPEPWQQLGDVALEGRGDAPSPLPPAMGTAPLPDLGGPLGHTHPDPWPSGDPHGGSVGRHGPLPPGTPSSITHGSLNPSAQHRTGAGALLDASHPHQSIATPARTPPPPRHGDTPRDHDGSVFCSQRIPRSRQRRLRGQRCHGAWRPCQRGWHRVTAGKRLRGACTRGEGLARRVAAPVGAGQTRGPAPAAVPRHHRKDRFWEAAPVLGSSLQTRRGTLPSQRSSPRGGKKNPPPQPSQRPPVPEHPSPAGARGGNRGTERRRLTADGKARQRGEKN